jgi:hypothetical protein
LGFRYFALPERAPVMGLERRAAGGMAFGDAATKQVVNAAHKRTARPTFQHGGDLAAVHQLPETPTPAADHVATNGGRPEHALVSRLPRVDLRDQGSTDLRDIVELLLHECAELKFFLRTFSALSGRGSWS